ncbi:zf-HC2 domain-containing protein [Streptomyces sp. URMC 123]|uniref:zf-HC2 domain-containing protein n=1 Tax=Streptomyces sp. URMC 123 TaxID=3423403 RepID=UPI003F1A556F
MSVPPGEGPHVRTFLGAYVLGALSGAEDRRVAAHLQYCDTCGAEYLDMAEAPSLLALFTEEDLLEGLAAPPHAPDGRRAGESTGDGPAETDED